MSDPNKDVVCQPCLRSHPERAQFTPKFVEAGKLITCDNCDRPSKTLKARYKMKHGRNRRALRLSPAQAEALWGEKEPRNGMRDV